MNKNDILQRSRAENQHGDEREEEIKLRSYATSASIGAVLCTLLVLIEEVVFERSANLIWIIYTGMMASKSILDAFQLKKKGDLLLSILWGLCFVIGISIYVLDNIG